MTTDTELTTRILDAWRIAKNGCHHQGDTFDIRAMAAIAAEVAHRGRTWTTGQTIPGDVDTIWVAPGVPFSRSDSDPGWWVVSEDVSEPKLLDSFGTVYEHEPTWTDTAQATNTVAPAPSPREVARRIVAGEMQSIEDARAALAAAVTTLEYIVDRRGAGVTVDLAERCGAQARACDKAWDQLGNLATLVSRERQTLLP